MATATPTFLRATAALEKWREQFNPFRGLKMSRLNSLLEESDRGLYSNVMWTLRKMERRDPTVRACKCRMLGELGQLEWKIGVAEELPNGITQVQVDAQKDYLMERYNALDNLKAAIRHLGLADLRGFSHCEKHYDDKGLPKRLECVPQWHWVRDGLYGPWKFDATAKGVDAARAADVEIEHFIVRESEDPWFEIAMIKSLRKNLGDKDFDGFLETFGIPYLFFVAPPGTTPDKLAEFQAVADDITSDARGVLPAGTDLKSTTGNASGTAAQVFKTYLDWQDSGIVLAATGGLLTVLTAPGSGTLAGSAHQEAWENIVSGVAKDVSETLQEQLDKPLLAEKFPGQPVLAWFELAYADEPESREQFVTDVKTLRDAGYSVKREVVQEKSGLELEEEEETPPPAPGPADPNAPPVKPPIKNRFAGGPASAHDTTEALQLAENAMASVLQVGADYLEPLRDPLQRLVDVAEDEFASLADFEVLAEEINVTFPELLDELKVDELAAELQKAMAPALVMGARASLRKRGALQNRKRSKPRK